MTRLDVSSRATGLRRLAIGGIPVTGAFEQMRHHLASTLGRDYEAFLAEPVDTADGVDWYTDLTGGPAARMTDLAGPERETATGRLAAMVRGLEAHVRELRGSARDYDRHLGQLLGHALQIPGPDHVWVVGGEPVLSFWGYTAELGEPTRSPVYDLLPPDPVPLPPDPPPAVPPVSPPPAPLEPLEPETDSVLPPPPGPTEDAGGGAGGRPGGWLTSLLWLLLLAQLAVILLLLLRPCWLALPFVPANCSSGALAALAAERDALRGEIAAKQAACVPSPVERETLDATMPAKDLAGCWESEAGKLFIGRGDKNTGVTVGYCFESDGETGAVSFLDDDGGTCRAPLKISRSETEIRFEYDAVPCSDGTYVQGGFWVCRSRDNGPTLCDGTDIENDGSPEPVEGRITGSQFHRIPKP